MADESTPNIPQGADEPGESKGASISRRGFLKTTGAGAVATYLASPPEAAEAKDKAKADPVLGPQGVPLSLKVNGKTYRLTVETRTTLAEALRDEIGLTGTKVVCDRGACGGCTVQLNGNAVCSCMMLACDAQGANITTVEGLAKGNTLHPLQQAFVEADALQCGYCTPGMLMSCKTLLDHNPNPSLDEVKHAVAGNLCRCGTYPHIFQAVLLAAKRMKKG